MRIRAVFDTNVIISGLLFAGPPSLLLKCVLSGMVELTVSPSLMDELERVLRLKFPHTRQAILDTLEELKEISVLALPKEKVKVITDDPDDNRVLECAIGSHADVIVSGDKHLLVLKKFRSIPILTSRQFLDSLTPKIGKSGK